MSFSPAENTERCTEIKREIFFVALWLQDRSHEAPGFNSSTVYTDIVGQ
jgi:hypothetical protein